MSGGLLLPTLQKPSSSRTLDLSELARETNLTIRDPGLQDKTYDEGFRSFASSNSTKVLFVAPGSRISSFLRPGFAWRKLTFRDDEKKENPNVRDDKGGDAPLTSPHTRA